jgi:hypothetical protein
MFALLGFITSLDLKGTYDGGKEKAPAALCRKVAQSKGSIEVWGVQELRLDRFFILMSV